MPQKFYLEHDVEVGGRQVKILGIMHSSDPFSEVTDRKLRKVILQRARKRPNVRIYSEFPINVFVPRELLGRTKVLETLGETNEAQRGGKILSFIPENIKDVQKKRLNPDFEKPTFIGKQLDAISRGLMPTTRVGKEAEDRREAARTITKRSLTMAQRILETPEKEMIVVVGASHSGQIKKFLENPKLRERYRRLWEKARKSEK